MAEYSFTLFVILPDENVSSLRNLISGISVEEVKARLELNAGLPSHIYTLLYPDGERLEDRQKLLMQENIKDGYVLKVQILEQWDTLYSSLSKNNIENVFHNGGVHLRGSMVINAEDSEKVESVVYDRGCVALYIASYLGLLRMCNMLVSVGINVNGSTQFGRTALHAVSAKDNHIVLKYLVDHGANLFCTDLFGKSPLQVAQMFSSYICEKQLKIMQLNLRGQNTKTRLTKVKYAIPIAEQKPVLLGSHSSQRPKSLITRSDTKIQTLRRPRPQTYNSPRHKYLTGSAKRNPVAWVTLQDSENKRDTVFPKFQNVKCGQMQDEIISCKPLTLLKKKPCLKFASEADDKVMSRSTQTTPVPSRLDVATTPMLFAPPSSRLTGEEENTGDEMNVSTSIDERAASAKTNKSAKLVSFSATDRPTFPEFPESSQVMKKRLNMVVRRSAPSNREASTPKRSGVIHDRWANTTKYSDKPVRPEISSSDDDDDDSVDIDGDSGNGSDANAEAYEAWLKRKELERKRMPRRVTRPIHDLIKIGSTEMGDARNPSSELNMTAYRDYLERRKQNRKTPNLERNKSMRDFMSQKKLLEEKRQKLLLNAISYDEWMDHDFDRKSLIKKILQADFEQLKLMESERKKNRAPHQISHEQWKQDVDKREELERRQREIQQSYFEEKEKWRKEVIRTSTNNEWIRQKNVQPRVLMRSNSKGSHVNDVKRAVEADRAYQEWVRRKHSEDVSDIQRKIETERELIKSERERRNVRMVAC